MAWLLGWIEQIPIPELHSEQGDAYIRFAEDIQGSIDVGKLADFVVIPVDYMTIPAEDIWKIEPDMTLIGSDAI